MCFEWWNRLFVDRDPVPDPATVPHCGDLS
jgi:hypothetical protein